MADIQVGSTVVLKSGGPVMTIQEIGKKSMDPNGADHAWCHWFDKNKLTTGVFPLTSLELND